jgi:hypothetical protein
MLDNVASQLKICLNPITFLAQIQFFLQLVQHQFRKLKPAVTIIFFKSMNQSQNTGL